MQNVKITSYSKPERDSVYTLQKKYYNIFVGNTTFYFKSERRLKLWLGELNRDLNELATECNFLIAEVFTEYRYYYSHYNSTERAHIEGIFKGLFRSFDMLTTRCNGHSSNSHAYHHFKVTLNAFTEIIDILGQHSMNKLATVQRYRLGNLKTRVEVAKIRLYTYPKGYDKRKDYEQ